MPYPADTTYPAAATKAAWLKQKSLIDKAGKTGVGPKLEAAETAWGKIPFKDLNSATNKPKNSQESKAALDKANLADGKVAAAMKALSEAIVLASAPATTKGLTGASKTALSTIVTQLKAAHRRLELMDDLPALYQVDHNNMLKEDARLKQEKEDAEHAALAELSKVSLKSGATLIATAAKAERKDDGAYWVISTDWKPLANNGLNYVAAKVTLLGTAKDGKAFSKNMDITSVGGNGVTKLK